MKSETEINSSQSWEHAKAYADMLGDVPSSFSSIIRSLLAGQLKNQGEIGASVRYQAGRLMSGPSVKAMLYFACRTFKDEELQGRDYVTVSDMTRLYSPMDLAAIIGTIFLFRKCKKMSEAASSDKIVHRFRQLVST